MSKQLLDSVFKGLKGGTFAVRYWDGREKVYNPGPGPSFTVIFNTEPTLLELAADPVLGLAESYMNGEIDFSGDLDVMFHLVHLNRQPGNTTVTGKLASAAMKKISGLRSKNAQKENIAAHYDLGNGFFSLWLDETLSYSSAYFEHPDDSLKQAQLNKIDLVLRKMRLQPGQRLLDIGCGWGWLIIRAARQYGVKALGITLSEEQYTETKKRIDREGLSEAVEVRLLNYLDLAEDQSFDAVVSIGMFEHVGQAHYQDYLGKVRDFLKPGGLSMLHTLTSLTETETNSWIKKYIFPGGYIPSLREVVSLLPEYEFQVQQIESLRRHYARTLEIWHGNFSTDEVREKVGRMFDDKFIRMWSLYLQGAASSLRQGWLDVHQIVFTKGVNNTLPLTLADIYGRC